MTATLLLVSYGSFVLGFVVGFVVGVGDSK